MEGNCKYYELGKPVEIPGGDLAQFLAIRGDLLGKQKELDSICHELNTIGCEGVEIVIPLFDNRYIPVDENYYLANVLYYWG